MHRTTTKTTVKPKQAPNYHVIIWNDEEHTYEYVIELLMKLFSHPFEKAFQITREVDKAGRGIAQHVSPGACGAEARSDSGVRGGLADENLERLHPCDH